MNTKLIVLGCGSSIGVPRIDGHWGKCDNNNKKNIRTRCSAAIIKGSNIILIDTSPDIKNQLISNKIRNISSVIFTHKHADQTNGLFELRPFYWKYKKKINVYGDASTINYLKKTQRYLFKKIQDYKPIAKAHLIKSRFSLGKLKEEINFKSIIVKHGKINSLGYIFNKTAYLSDCKDLSIIHLKELRNLNFLILDCLKITTHPSHFNLKEALYVIRHLKPGKTILTNLHNDLDYKFLLRKLPKNVLPAYDGLSINI